MGQLAIVFVCLTAGTFVLVWLGTTIYVAAELGSLVAKTHPTYFYASLVALSVIFGLTWNSCWGAILLGVAILGLCPLRLFVSRFIKPENDRLFTHPRYKTLVMSSSVPAGFVAVILALTGIVMVLYVSLAR